MTARWAMFAVADCANGIGTKLEVGKWTFMNTDVVCTCTAFRTAVDRRSRGTNYGPDGISTTIGAL
jgi:hypothetical protein